MATTKRSAHSNKNTLPSGVTLEEFSRRLKATVPQGKSLTDLLTTAGFHAPLHVAYFEEPRVRRFLEWFVGLCSTKLSNAPESRTTFGTSLSSTAALEALLVRARSESLFSPAQIEVIANADQTKGEILSECLTALTKHSLPALVIFTWNAEAKTLPSAQQAPGTWIHIPRLTGPALKTWMQREVSRLGNSGGISADACEHLSSVFQDDLSGLSQALTKAVMSVEATEKIDLSRIHELVKDSPERSGLELVQAMSQRRLGQALALLNVLVTQGQHPLQLCSFLQRAFRIMLHDISLSDLQAATVGDLNHPWLRRQLRPLAQAFSATDLTASLQELARLDTHLRDSRIPAAVETEICIERITTRGYAT